MRCFFLSSLVFHPPSETTAIPLVKEENPWKFPVNFGVPNCYAFQLLTGQKGEKKLRHVTFFEWKRCRILCLLLKKNACKLFFEMKHSELDRHLKERFKFSILFTLNIPHWLWHDYTSSSDNARKSSLVFRSCTFSTEFDYMRKMTILIDFPQIYLYNYPVLYMITMVSCRFDRHPLSRSPPPIQSIRATRIFNW